VYQTPSFRPDDRDERPDQDKTSISSGSGTACFFENFGLKTESNKHFHSVHKCFTVMMLLCWQSLQKIKDLDLTVRTMLHISSMSKFQAVVFILRWPEIKVFKNISLLRFTYIS